MIFWCLMALHLSSCTIIASVFIHYCEAHQNLVILKSFSMTLAQKHTINNTVHSCFENFIGCLLHICLLSTCLSLQLGFVFFLLSDSFFFSFFKAMKVCHLSLPSMPFLLVIFLLVVQLCSSCHGRRITIEVEKRLKGDNSPTSTGFFYNYKISPSQSHVQDDSSPMFGMFERLVPQGPNPLHH